jgi:RHS repeat-associated protein
MTARRRTTPITRWAGRATVLVTSCALVAGLLVVLDTTTAPVPAQAATAAVLERPDEVTAQMAARAQGSKVEVSGARTESRRVWANPDGSFTSEMFPGQNWTKDAAGNWQEIDTTLVRGTDGSVTPKAAAVEVTLAGPTPDQAGAVPVVTMEVAKASLGELAAAHEDPSLEAPAADEAGTSVASLTLATQGGLPAPTLDGAQATYAGFEPGRDLRVTVLPGGVETFVDLAAAPASIPAAGVEVALPLSAKGLTVAEDGDGGLVIKDAKTGAVVGTTPQSRIWDASIDEVSGESEHGIVVDTELRKTSTGYLVIATVPASYFATPGLTYPITVDPSATLPPSKDTYVEKGYNDTSFGGEIDLKVGTYDGGTHVARSYLQFTLSDAANLYDTTDETTVVDSAKLKLWEWHAASCTASAMNIRYLTSAFTAADSTWNTKPTQSGAIYTVSDAHRDDSSGACAEGWFDTTSGTEVKSIVQGWADGDYTNYGLALTASETASSGWKRFYSAQYATSARRPSLVLTYHHVPKKPTSIGVGGATMVSGTAYVNTLTPQIKAAVSDLDGGNVRLKATVGSWSGYSGYVSSGLSSPYVTLGGITAPGTYSVSLAANDGTNSSAAVTQSIVIDQSPPVTPTVTSTSFPAGQWAATGSGTFSLASSSSDVTGWQWSFDGTTWATAAGGPSFITPTIAAPAGWDTLQVRAVDRAGNRSAATSYTFGVPAVTSPAENARTLRFLNLGASGPASGTKVAFQYQLAGETAWANIPYTAVKIGQNPLAADWPVNTVVDATSAKAPANLTWDMPATLSGDASVKVRALFSGGSSSTTLNSPVAILDSHAYGLTYATTDTPAGAVSLLTGNLAIAGSDAAVTSFGGGISADRTFNSNDPMARTPGATFVVTTKALTANTATLTTSAPHTLSLGDTVTVTGVDATFNGTYTVTAATATTFSYAKTATAVTSVAVTPNGLATEQLAPFGPGWATTLGSAESDWAKAEDLGAQIRVTDSDGGQWYFAKPGAGTNYLPIADAAVEGLKLSKTGTAATRAVTLTDADGSTVSFAPTASTWTGTPTLTVPDIYRVQETKPAGVTGQTQFSYNADGSTNYTIAPGPPSTYTGGVTTCTSANAGTKAGCRVLAFSYVDADPGTAVATRLGKVTLKTMSAAGAAVSMDVACYTYDATAGYRLAKVWDPRLSGTGGWASTCGTPASDTLETTYAYTGDGRVASIASAGINATAIAYHDTSIPGSAPGTFKSATQSIAGTDLATTVLYNAFDPATAPAGSEHPDLRAGIAGAGVARWGQTAIPLTTTVVYGSGDIVSTTNLVDGVVHALNSDGREVNTGVYSGTGEAGWRIDTTEYDTFGNPVRTLSAANRDRALNPTYGPYVGELEDLGLTGATSVEIAAALDERSIYSADGTDLLETFGPAHMIALPGGGAVEAIARAHTVTTYGTIDYTPTTTPPSWLTQAPLHTPLTRTASATLGIAANATTSEPDAITTSYAYGLSDTDHPGWDLRQPMSTTVGDATTTVTTVTRYSADTNGRSTGVGNVIEQRQPSATVTADPGTRVTTYYAAGTHNPAGCVSDHWYGQVCKVGPGAQPSGNGLPELPTTTYTYDTLLRPVTTTEAVTGSANRVTTTTYRNSGASSQIDQTATTGGLGTAVAATIYGYDTASGLPTTTSNGTASQSVAYDALGRITIYTDADGAKTKTTYDSHGRTATLEWLDTTGATLGTATYGYDAGSGEHRGVLTSIDHTGFGTITGTYSPGGALTSQTLPGGITQTFTTNTIDDATATSWTQGSDEFLTSTQTSDIHGRWREDKLSGAHPGWTARDYTYDGIGRLTRTEETRTGACLTRTYAFTTNSNRSNTTTYPDNGGTCTTSTTPTASQDLQYDNADRMTATGPASGTVYDAWGRITTLPAALTSTPAAGAATSSYYANDLVRSLTQNSVTRTWTLDPAGRLATMTTTGAGSTALTNHYTDTSSDSPAWTKDTDTTGTATTRRYLPGLAGYLAEFATNAGGTTSQIQLTNLHGDVIRTTTPTATGSPDGPGIDTDEYGVIHDTTGATTTGPRYGWLGGKQRATDTGTTGLTLMGVRLYAPLLGRFLSTDPVYGGNSSAYGYPADPINQFDLDGKRRANEERGGGAWWALESLFQGVKSAGHRKYVPGQESWQGRKVGLLIKEQSYGSSSRYPGR